MNETTNNTTDTPLASSADKDEWVCNGSLNKVLQGYLLSGFLVIIGLMFLFVFKDESPDAVLIGFVQLAFAVLVGALAYRGGKHSKRLLVMNRDGICFRGWGASVIPWHNIAEIDVGGSRINAFLRVTLSDERAARPTLKIPGSDIAAPLDLVRKVAQDYLSANN